jgi:hypothetical protein
VVTTAHSRRTACLHRSQCRSSCCCFTDDTNATL